MGAEDASSAEMPKPPRQRRGADPLALDDATVDRLLAGTLRAADAPPGYAKVAELLAATVAPPTPGELAGQEPVLAELRAAARARRADRSRRAARTPRRRWAGLAAVALVGALVTGGVAAAASGSLPTPVRNVARSILGAGGGAGPVAPTQPGQQPAAAGSSAASARTNAGPKGPQPAGSTTPGSDRKAVGPVTEPDKEGLCKAFLAGQHNKHEKMDATAFERLAEAAGGESRIPTYCNGTQPGDPNPNDQGQQPPGGQGQGQGGSPPGNGDDQAQGQPPSTRSSSR
jgi:hypothetical protein